MKENMIILESIEAFDEAKKKKAISVFVFSADWCPDCLFIKTFFPKLMKQYPNHTFYYVDRDEGMEIAQANGIMGIPSFVAYYDGVEIDRFVSRFRKSEQEIDAFLKNLADKTQTKE